jgi:hypothetical protein
MVAMYQGICICCEVIAADVTGASGISPLVVTSHNDSCKKRKKIDIVIAIPRWASAMPCKQGNKQPVVV